MPSYLQYYHWVTQPTMLCNLYDSINVLQCVWLTKNKRIQVLTSQHFRLGKSRKYPVHLQLERWILNYKLLSDGKFCNEVIYCVQLYGLVMPTLFNPSIFFLQILRPSTSCPKLCWKHDSWMTSRWCLHKSRLAALNHPTVCSYIGALNYCHFHTRGWNAGK